MRLFYLPNENVMGDQVGPRRAFEMLKSEGVLQDFSAYSYLVEARKFATHVEAKRDLLEAARVFSPDIIYAQHINERYPVDGAFMAELKNLPCSPKLVIHEGDAYGRFVKRIDKTLAATFAEADMVILVGLGVLADLAHTFGAKRIRFVTQSYDSQRFGTDWVPTRSRKFDAVMVANCQYLRGIPGLYMPGGRLRAKSAKEVHKVLGDRFAVYGYGGAWEGKSYARGPVKFENQIDVIRDAWMSVNWHHFDDISMYSSDRLPISLSCGVPHITNYQEGYSHIFENIPGCFLVRSPREMRDVALYLLSLPVERRNELGLQAAAHARLKFSAEVVYRDVVTMLREHFFGGAAS